MKLEESTYHQWTKRTWHCCRNKWELVLTPACPDRENWHPTCPSCGSTIEEKNEEKSNEQDED